jgi:hypothetical protein
LCVLAIIFSGALGSCICSPPEVAGNATQGGFCTQRCNTAQWRGLGIGQANLLLLPPLTSLPFFSGVPLAPLLSLAGSSRAALLPPGPLRRASAASLARSMPPPGEVPCNARGQHQHMPHCVSLLLLACS